MISRKEGLTDINHLAETMIKYTSLNTDKNIALSIIDRYLERCVEGYLDGKLAGYFLIFNVAGKRSFHGYKLVNGYSVAAYKLSKDFMKDYKDISITTTNDKTQVHRLAKLLNVKLERV